MKILDLEIFAVEERGKPSIPNSAKRHPHISLTAKRIRCARRS
jgi:hypothetical protein